MLNNGIVFASVEEDKRNDGSNAQDRFSCQGRGIRRIYNSGQANF